MTNRRNFFARASGIIAGLFAAREIAKPQITAGGIVNLNSVVDAASLDTGDCSLAVPDGQLRLKDPWNKPWESVTPAYIRALLDDEITHADLAQAELEGKS